MRKAIFILFALSGIAAGQIIVPAENEDRHPIIAKMQAEIPDGASVEGPGWIVPDGVRIVKVDPTTVHIWADPGDYSIGFKAWWIQVEDVTFTDGSGQDRTIKQYVAHGYVDENAEFKVLGAPAPDPNPPDPAPEPDKGGKDVAFFVPSDLLDNLPDAQREVFASRLFRDKLAEKGHRLIGLFDPGSEDDYPGGGLDEWFDAVKGDRFPRMAFRPSGGGEIVDVDLPKTTDQIFLILSGGPI